jgi:hypothetical protein
VTKTDPSHPAVTAQVDGYLPRSETLKLPEGTTKELELVLDKQ